MVGVENNYNSTISFTSSSALKKADDIRRLVVREFPNTYSNTKLDGYHVLDKTYKFKGYKNYVGDLIAESRKYYTEPDDMSLKLAREITILKKNKIGNCGEMADVAYMALKLNGYKDVKILNLYAYNPSTKTMRDLQHTVAGVNFRLPKNYEYCRYASLSSQIDSRHRIYPQNDSIIVDSWAGFSEYGKNAVVKYNSRYDLIKGIKKPLELVKEGETLLKKGEKLCFVPVYENELFAPDRLASYGNEYPGVILPKSKGGPKKHTKPLPTCKEIEEKTMLRLKGKHNLKASPSAEELKLLEEEYMQNVYAKLGIVPVPENRPKKNIFKKITDFFR